MKISWLRAVDDDNNFKIFKNMGFDVFEVEDLDKTDEKIQELVDKKYQTIVVTNDVAANSGDIVTKYKYDEYVNIIVSARGKES